MTFANKGAKFECLLWYVYGLLAIGRRSIDIGMCACMCVCVCGGCNKAFHLMP